MLDSELLKYAHKKPATTVFHTLFEQVWKTGKVLIDWRENIIITLKNCKDDRTFCSSNRPISLLSVRG
jgi:hypothetical protein